MDSPDRPAATFVLRTGDGEVELAVTGELDLANAAELTAAIASALAGTESLRVDLAGVTFADSTALGALVGAHERALTSGKLLCVSAVSDVVEALFHIAGLADELRC